MDRRTEPTAPLPPQADPAAGGSLLTLLRQRTSLRERMRLLSKMEASGPGLAHQVDLVLSRASATQLMFDHVLRLLKVWQLHRLGEEAECEYYLCAFRFGAERARIRDWLGISRGWATERLVFLVTVDCLRADHVSCNGYAVPTTPAIDALAGQGVNFSRAYATAGHTYLSFPGILLSSFYQNFGRGRAVPDHQVTLAEMLSRNGFHTVAYNAANPLISRFYNYDRGFDEFYDFLEVDSATEAGDSFAARSQLTQQEAAALLEQLRAEPGIVELLGQMVRKENTTIRDFLIRTRQVFRVKAAEVVKDTIGSLLHNRRRPALFYWLHLMDVHEDISVPFSRLGSFGPAEQILLNGCTYCRGGREVLSGMTEKYRQLYDSAVSYVDMNLEILRNLLADSGLLEASLICLTADHGQELMERGFVAHGPKRLRYEVVHVPLVFGGGLARRISGQCCDRPVSTLDIAPTILDVCGIEQVPRTFLGKTLNDMRPRPVYGQSFYDGIQNRARADGVLWRCYTGPRPGAVKDHCKEMFFCIEGDYQLIHDAGTGKSELHRLPGLPGARTDGEPPDPERLKLQAQDYFEQVYALPERDATHELSESERAVLERRLRELGYL